MNNPKDKPLIARFLDTKPRVLLELSNESDETLKAVEILAIFLKADGTVVPEQAQVKFDVIKALLPQQSAVVSHRTWIDSQPVNDERDQMGRIKLVAGEANPYVLHISWQNCEGKARFQRIPVSGIN
jgi:hypothetical protein